jgi:hypothetical protein
MGVWEYGSMIHPHSHTSILPHFTFLRILRVSAVEFSDRFLERVVSKEGPGGMGEDNAEIQRG